MDYKDSERFLKHNHLKRVPDFDYMRLSDEEREQAYKDSVMRLQAILMIMEYIGLKNG